MNWSNQQTPQNLTRTPSLLSTTDLLDNSEMDLLNMMGDDEIARMLDDDGMLSQLDSLLDQEAQFSTHDTGALPILDANIMDANPSSSTFMDPNFNVQPDIVTTEYPAERTPFKELNTKISNVMSRIPFDRSYYKGSNTLANLNFAYNPEIDVGLQLRKFDYFQLCECYFYEDSINGF
jgi:hypothetical protein